LIRKQLAPLPPRSTLSASAAADIRSRVQALNAQITAVAESDGAVVYGLHGIFAHVRATGISAGSKTSAAGYLGGFYSMQRLRPQGCGER